jgi:hypothetical protein
MLSIVCLFLNCKKEQVKQVNMQHIHMYTSLQRPVWTSLIRLHKHVQRLVSWFTCYIYSSIRFTWLDHTSLLRVFAHCTNLLTQQPTWAASTWCSWVYFGSMLKLYCPSEIVPVSCCLGIHSHWPPAGLWPLLVGRLTWFSQTPLYSYTRCCSESTGPVRHGENHVRLQALHTVHFFLANFVTCYLPILDQAQWEFLSFIILSYGMRIVSSLM